MNKLTSKCNDCPSRKPYWEHIDGTKEYQCVEIVCKRQGEKPQTETPTNQQKCQLSEETPTNAPTDLIRRVDAIKAFSVYNGNRIPEVDCDNFPIEIPIKQVKDTIRSLPSADDEKPCKTCGYYKFECPQDCEYNKSLINTSQGEWEPSYTDIPTTCSVCGEDWDKYVYGAEVWYTGELPKFCPNCGVKMKGSNEE